MNNEWFLFCFEIYIFIVVVDTWINQQLVRYVNYIKWQSFGCLLLIELNSWKKMHFMNELIIIWSSTCLICIVAVCWCWLTLPNYTCTTGFTFVLYFIQLLQHMISKKKKKKTRRRKNILYDKLMYYNHFFKLIYWFWMILFCSFCLVHEWWAIWTKSNWFIHSLLEQSFKSLLLIKF